MSSGARFGADGTREPTAVTAAPFAPDPVERCPKRMVFGPCGGVRADGSCELDAARPCPWADPDDPVDLRRWPGPGAPDHHPDPGTLLATARERPVVMTDLSVPAYDLATLRSVAAEIGPVSDTVLVGDIHHSPGFPPSVMAAELLDAGARPWITLTCRDSNRVVLEQELAGLAALGVEGVLCVTGDGRGPDVRPGATQVFDLDSTRLTHLAHRAGLVPTVTITPASPPTHRRAAGLREKQRAGASLVIANHVASPAVLDGFLREARGLGVDLPVIAAVAVYSDEDSARVLTEFPGLALDPSAVDAVLSAPDPVAAGIDAAVAEARALLAVPGVVGVNLSGRASSAGWSQAANMQAEIARRVRGEAA